MLPIFYSEALLHRGQNFTGLYLGAMIKTLGNYQEDNISGVKFHNTWPQYSLNTYDIKGKQAESSEGGMMTASCQVNREDTFFFSAGICLEGPLSLVQYF